MQIEIVFEAKDDSPVNFNYKYPLFSAITTALTEEYPEEKNLTHTQERGRFVLSSLISSSSKSEIITVENEKKINFGKFIKMRIASPSESILVKTMNALIAKEKINIQKKVLFLNKANFITPPKFKQNMVWKPYYFGGVVVKDYSNGNFIFPEGNCPIKKDYQNSQKCSEFLKNNLLRKYNELSSLYSAEDVEIMKECGFIYNNEEIKISFGKNIKTFVHENKKDENFIRIFSWATEVLVDAPPVIQKLIYDCGMGIKASIGYGLMNFMGEEK